MKVSEVMTTDVKMIAPEASIQDAAKEMVEFDIGCLIVSKSEKLEGIITEMDIIKRAVAKGKVPQETKVDDIMSSKVIYVDPEISIEDASDIMVQNKIKKLPVVKDNQLLGLLTIDDIAMAQPKLIEQISKIMALPGKKSMAGG